MDEAGDPGSEYDMIIDKVVAGNNRRRSGTAIRDDSAGWTKYEIFE